MQITVVGAGYVGLVTAVCRAAMGDRISLVERSAERLGELEAGRIPISEPGVAELFEDHRGAISLFDRIPPPDPGSLTFIAVGTPIDAGESDLSQLVSALDGLRPWPESHVSVRSTLPPGTSSRLPALLGRSDGRHISTNPEFLRQGSAVDDFNHPSRIILGRFPETTEEHLALLDSAYAGVEAPRMTVEIGSAELIKNVSNAFLALKLSFVNEVAGLAEEYGADVDEILKGISYDPRIGSSYMRPGLGFGGSCLPKELQVLASAGRKQGLPMHVARAAALVNDEQQDRFARSILRALDRTPSRIGLLGLAFKADTDDLRGSPAATVARRLLAAGHEVAAFDPVVDSGRAVAEVPGLIIKEDPAGVFDGADAIVVGTEWPQFKTLDWSALGGRMRGALLFDGRNLLDPSVIGAAGLTYRGVGRAVTRPIAAGVGS